jgi:ketosteroid isomerase-like protein
MPGDSRLDVAKACYAAFVSGDRDAVERVLADEIAFFSPADPGIDRDAYFERCWPNSHMIEAFAFKRLEEVGDEVLVTYEATKTDGKRFRNTEILGFEDGRISRMEVYFGWDLA